MPMGGTRICDGVSTAVAPAMRKRQRQEKPNGSRSRARVVFGPSGRPATTVGWAAGSQAAN